MTSQGRAFAVEARYVGRRSTRLDDDVVAAVLRALSQDPGSLLVFLPGQGEIQRVADRLKDQISDTDIDIAPLYGALTPAAQDLAVAPSAPGRRKIVLATSIAETSLTIDGVCIVIDSGLARVPRFEPDIGISRLETVRVSRAAADQRMGRAGRTAPGICYRLWDEPETQGLVPFADPEIKSADLSSLLLDCAAWGAADPRSLMWLDPPSEGLIKATRAELQLIGALDDRGQITVEGRQLRALPLPPRLARMIISAGKHGAAIQAAEIAAVLVERGIGGTDADLAIRLENFRRDRSRRADDLRRLARGWADAAPKSTIQHGSTPSVAHVLALAFPERIAKARGSGGQFLLANGRAGTVDSALALASAPYLVVAELQGRAAATRILLAAATDEAEFIEIAGDRLAENDELTFDTEAQAVRARRVRRVGAIMLAAEQRAVPASEDAACVLANGIAAAGVHQLAWSKPQLQLRQRVAFLQTAGVQDWPDLSDAALAAAVRTWLQPFLSGKTKMAEIGADDLGQALDVLLPWPLRQRLEAEAPTHFEAPTGNRFSVDYEGAGAPAVHIRVQELFGLRDHPAIAGGRLPLTLNLLSPAHRPIQITRDLPGFWAGSWGAVRADMRGQYPKHVWPEDPARALPTARAKPRG